MADSTRNHRYRLREHTADLKVEIYGRDLPELFVNAAFMIFDVMLELDQVVEQQVETVEIKSADLPELLLDWLRELLFLFSVRGFVCRQVRISRLSSKPAELEALLAGETYDPKRHGLKIEIKTPTYHQYAVERLPEGYRATVVFDV
ncbi:MAG: archease [candidate division WOR-3 bacterium]|jgi:SHS2 domain-containing protein